MKPVKYAQLPTEEQRMEKIRQRALNYVNSLPQLRFRRLQERLDRRLRRLSKGLNERERDVIVRWNARKQKRLLEQNITATNAQKMPRKM